MTGPPAPPPPSSRLSTLGRVGVVVVLLYAFLTGIKALEGGIEAFGSDLAQGLFDNVAHPLAGLFAGILATGLVQSSSVTTATIVGLVGAGALPVSADVPMIMGTNIGTTITNTIVSLGHIRQGNEFRRAFAGATVHDFFNLLTVIIVLPLELATGFLSTTAAALAGLVSDQSTVAGGVGESPIQTALAWPIEVLSQAIESASAVTQGIVLLVVGMVLIFIALTFITRSMRALMAGGIERSMNRVLDRGAGLGAMALGMVVTMLVQSSSITTSILIPMLAAGILTIQNAYPVTLGANLGTTITALLASIAVGTPAALTIALVHTLFNATGILLFYPVPAMRRIPIRLAEILAEVAQRRTRWALAYVGVVFVLIPFLGVLVLR